MHPPAYAYACKLKTWRSDIFLKISAGAQNACNRKWWSCAPAHLQHCLYIVLNYKNLATELNYEVVELNMRWWRGGGAELR